mmetsp:Transcript_4672/g.14373  ORF Transcript_4672/g.14373 Transcript_4672/m.14373 type:complete len:220 (+) Transcript_4672:78-737(+)
MRRAATPLAVLPPLGKHLLDRLRKRRAIGLDQHELHADRRQRREPREDDHGVVDADGRHQPGGRAGPHPRHLRAQAQAGVPRGRGEQLGAVDIHGAKSGRDAELAYVRHHRAHLTADEGGHHACATREGEQPHSRELAPKRWNVDEYIPQNGARKLDKRAEECIGIQRARQVASDVVDAVIHGADSQPGEAHAHSHERHDRLAEEPRHTASLRPAGHVA